MTLSFRVAACIAGALLALSLPAGAAETQPIIIVYGNVNATGDNITIQAAVPNLLNSGFNDRISSVVVVAGTWELCDSADYKGKCVTLGQGLHNLDATINNLASSLRPVAASTEKTGAVVLFLDKDGGGKSLRLTAKVARLADFVGFNDAVSSIAIFGGTWEFCQKNDFKGKCVSLAPGVYNLEDFNNTIDSLRIK